MPEHTPDWRQIIRPHLRDGVIDQDAFDEVVEHAEELYRSSLAGGATADEARAAVEAELVNLPALMRAARAAKRRRLAPAPVPPPSGPGQYAATFARDLLYAARLLVARPAFTAVAVITLALGIGANTAIFSLMYTVLLAPVPFPNADRLVRVWENPADNPQNITIVSGPNYKDWQAQVTSFEQMAIWESRQFNVSGGEEPVQVFGMRVSASLFLMLGAQPQLGRTFTEVEDAPGHDVVVLGDDVWRRRFGGRGDIVGQTLRVNGRPHEVIGVMPPSFVFVQRRHQIWVPIAFNTEADVERGSHSFMVAARLRDGVTFDAAKREMEATAARLAQEHRENEGESATITPLTDVGSATLSQTFSALSGAVALLLLIACVNVANLLLAQASVRHREFSIRAALGASRSRLAAQLFAEGLLLSCVGAAAGVFVAWGAIAVMRDALPWSVVNAPFRAAIEAPLSTPVLLFTTGVALLTAMLFSLAPMLGIARDTTGASLKSSGGRSGTGIHSRARGVLIAAEVALAVVILAGAGLMIKSMARLLAVDPGLDPERVVVSSLALPQKDLYGPPERTTFCADLDQALRRIPGVAAAGAVSHLPLSGSSAGRGLSFEGRTPPERGFGASYRLTCPGYFEALGIKMVRGRDFTHADATTAPGVAIINEELVKQYWPGEDVLGRRVKIGAADSSNRWLTIVGIARTVRHTGLDVEPNREIFLPYTQSAWPVMTVVVRSAGAEAPLADMRRALRDLDPDRPVAPWRTMDDVIAESTGPRRFPMLLLAAFAAVALTLAVIGVFGVVSYLVNQRTREIGIRMALGARASQLVMTVVRRSLVPVAGGVVLGIAGAIVSSRFLESFLFEVTPYDPAVLAAVAALLTASAFTASLVPARRAATVDPIVVLKEE